MAGLLAVIAVFNDDHFVENGQLIVVGFFMRLKLLVLEYTLDHLLSLVQLFFISSLQKNVKSLVLLVGVLSDST